MHFVSGLFILGRPTAKPKENCRQPYLPNGKHREKSIQVATFGFAGRSLLTQLTPLRTYHDLSMWARPVVQMKDICGITRV